MYSLFWRQCTLDEPHVGKAVEGGASCGAEEIELKCLAFRQQRTLLVELSRPGCTLLAPLTCTMALLCGPPPELGQDALSLLHLSLELAGELRAQPDATGAGRRLDGGSRLLGGAPEGPAGESPLQSSSEQPHAPNTRAKAIAKLNGLTDNLKLAQELAGQETLERLFKRWLYLSARQQPPLRPKLRAHFMVMISYNRREGQPYAVRLKAALEELAISVYLDVHEIRAGSDWQDSLNEALLHCRALVPLVTPSYGRTLWTRRELKAADVLGKRIIPVNFQARWPPDPLAIQFATLQYISWLESGAFPRGTEADSARSVARRIWRALDKDIRDEDDGEHNAADVKFPGADTCPAPASRLSVSPGDVADYRADPPAPERQTPTKVGFLLPVGRAGKRKKTPSRTSADEPASPDAKTQTPSTWWRRRRRKSSGGAHLEQPRRISIRWCAAEACTRVKRLLIS